MWKHPKRHGVGNFPALFHRVPMMLPWDALRTVLAWLGHWEQLVPSLSAASGRRVDARLEMSQDQQTRSGPFGPEWLSAPAPHQAGHGSVPPCRTQLGAKRSFARRVCPRAGIAAPPGAFPLPGLPPKLHEGQGCSRSAPPWVPADTRGSGLDACRPPPGPTAGRAASHRASERPSHDKGEQRRVPPCSPPTRVPTAHLRAGGGGGRGEGGSSSPWSRRRERPRTEGGRDEGRRRGEASPAPLPAPLAARSGTESAAAPAGIGTTQAPLPTFSTALAVNPTRRP